MENLAKNTCVPCRGGVPTATDKEIEEYMRTLPQWQVIEEGTIKKLKRSFKTENYDETIRFVNAIADVSSAQDHHPVMLVEFNQVTVWWWTHKIKGLHRNDFIMAAKTDEIFS